MTAVPEPSRACLSSRVFENNVLSGERTKSQMIWMSRPQSLLSASKMFSLGSTQDHWRPLQRRWPDFGPSFWILWDGHFGMARDLGNLRWYPLGWRHSWSHNVRPHSGISCHPLRRWGYWDIGPRNVDKGCGFEWTGLRKSTISSMIIKGGNINSETFAEFGHTVSLEFSTTICQQDKRNLPFREFLQGSRSSGDGILSQHQNAINIKRKGIIQFGRNHRDISLRMHRSRDPAGISISREMRLPSYMGRNCSWKRLWPGSKSEDAEHQHHCCK